MPIFTLSSLRTKALARVDNNALYTTAEVDFIINEAIRITALATGFYRLTMEYPGFTVADQLVYTTPSDILIPSVISFESRQLQKISLKRLARLRRNWATDTTTTLGRVEFWAPIGRSQFVLSPLDAVGGRDLTITGIGEPPLLVAGTDVMALENEYVELITEYCVHRLPLKQGGKTFADGSLALNTFYAKLKERGSYEAWAAPKYRVVPVKKESS